MKCYLLLLYGFLNFLCTRAQDSISSRAIIVDSNHNREQPGLPCYFFNDDTLKQAFAYSLPCTPAKDTLMSQEADASGSTTRKDAATTEMQAMAGTGGDTLPASGQPLYRLNLPYLKSYVSDLKYVVTRPIHWKKKDWKIVSATAVATAGLMASDWQVRQIFQANQNTFTNSVSKVVEPFGNFYGLYIFPVLYVTGVLTQQRKVESIGLSGVKSLAISTAVYTVSKKMIRRRRPDEASSSFDYALPFAKNRYTSTPSGHSNTIFTVATALALEFKHVKWVPPALYALASATAISRIYQNRHWGSDVLLGSLLGHFVTKAVWKNNDVRKKKNLAFVID